MEKRLNKILFIISSLSVGGAEKQMSVDANGLLGKGYSVSIIYANDGPLRNHLSDQIVLYQVDNGYFTWIKIYRHLLNNRYDVIFSVSLWANKKSALPAKLTNHRLVMFEHGLGLWRNKLVLGFAKLISCFAEKIIITSEASRKSRIYREKINPGKLLKVYNSYKMMPDLKNNKDRKPNKEYFAIGCVSRFETVKQLHYFIKICELLLENGIDTFKIILVGKGLTWSKLKEEVDVRNFNDYFEIPGYVDDLNNLYFTLDLFILPSKREDLSIALIEASGAGIPCIAFDVGGNSEIIVNTQTGFLIRPFDLKEMVSKIMYMMKNHVECKEMGKNAKVRVIDNFSEEKRLANLEFIIAKHATH